MKKDPANYTPGEVEYVKRKADVKAGKPNADLFFRNIAVTVDGVLCIGMTYIFERENYTCTYTESDGVRDFGGSHRWDKNGISLDDSISDLNLDSINDGVRKI